MRIHRFPRLPVLLVFGVLLLLVATASGQPEDMGGWEADGKYNRYFDVREMDEFKCTVKKVFEVAPLPGMTPGVALLVEESEDDLIPVHICPTWYQKTDALRLRKGDRVKIRGAWAEIDGEDVFMATKIKKGAETVIKVRLTKSGKPFWVMGDAELRKELESD